MNSLLVILFWITATVGTVAAIYAAGALGLISFLVLVGALLR